jgi:hypothetical protein
MKLILSCITIVFPLSVCFSQAPQPLWGVQYNGGGTDNGRAIAIDKNNNIYVTGMSAGKSTGNDISTVKYNSEGKQLWAQRYSGTGNYDDYPYAIATSDSGYVYVAGRSMAPNGKYDYVVVKYDGSGSQKWAVRYDGPGHLNDQAHDVKVDSHGNVFVTGGTEGVGQFNGFVITTLKYGAGGSLLWVDNYDNMTNPTTDAASGREEGNSLALDDAGNIYLAGVSSDMMLIKYNDLLDANGKPYSKKEWVRSIAGGSNGRKILYDGTNAVATGFGGITVKYSPLGVELWNAARPTATTSYWNLALDPTGNVYLTGTSSDHGNKEDFTTTKIDGASGSQSWFSVYDGSFHDIDIARDVAVDALGNVYIVGHSVVNDGSRNGATNFTVVAYNNAGVQQWASQYNPNKSGSDGFGVAVDVLGNIYATGQVAVKAANSDYGTIKYPAAVQQITSTARDKSRIPNVYFNSYPNPVINTATIEFELTAAEKVRLSVVDISGKEVALLFKEPQTASKHSLNYSVGKLTPGIYFFRLQHGTAIEIKRFVVVK